MKNIKPYKQKGDTCAIVCMLKTLEYFKKIDEVNWHLERKYYRIYHSKYMKGTPLSAVAYHLAKQKLNVTMYHSDVSLFSNNNTFEQELFDKLMNEYNEFISLAEERGALVKRGCNINIGLIKQLIHLNKIIILSGEIDKCLHTILVVDYDDNVFQVIDSLYKEVQYKSDIELEKFMNTSIGKWFIG